MAKAELDGVLNAVGLTEDYSCGYCLQRYIYMTDPRILPCNHVFCLPCLQADFTHLDALQCGVCQRTHNIEDLTSLPKAEIQIPGGEGGEEVEVILCDVCKDNSSRADSFCVDCNSKLCHHHTKIHEAHLQEFSGIQHETISIYAYKAEPQVYRKVKCAEHGEYNLQLACSGCHKIFCVQCKMNSICDISTEDVINRHTILSLDILANEQKIRMKGSLKDLSKKISNLGRLEKEAWLQCDDVEQEVTMMMEKVESFTEKMISEIRRETKKLKTEIQDYLNMSIKTVEKFTSDVRAKKEEMEILWRSTQQLVDHSHNTDVVSRYDETIRQLEDGKKAIEQISPCMLRFKTIVPAAEEKLATQRLVDVPSGIEHERAYATYARTHYSVKAMGDDKILCGTSRGVEMRSANNLSLLASSENVQFYYDVVPAKESIIGLRRTTAGLEVSCHDWRDLKCYRVLKSVNTDNRHVCRIAISGENIFFVNTNGKNNQLQHISLLSDRADIGSVTFDTLVEKPFALCALPDGSILVSDYKSEGSVTKYKFDTPTSFEHVWTCTGIAATISIAYDPSSQLIYAAGLNRKIAVISPYGHLLKMIEIEQLKELDIIRDITISGEQLILVCRRMGLARYNIRY